MSVMGKQTNSCFIKKMPALQRRPEFNLSGPRARAKNPKQRPVCPVRRRQKPPAVALNNQATHGEFKSHSVRFRCGVKYAVQVCGVNSGSCVLDFNNDCVIAVALGSQLQCPAAVL